MSTKTISKRARFANRQRQARLRARLTVQQLPDGGLFVALPPAVLARHGWRAGDEVRAEVVGRAVLLGR